MKYQASNKICWWEYTLNKKSVVAVFTSNKIERGMTIEIWPLRANLFEFPSNEWDMT